MKKKESLKYWCREWSLRSLVSHIYSEGITFAFRKYPHEMTQKDADEYKNIMLNEIKRRMRIKKK